MSSNQALIFGAGKIGRGFIAHLLHAANYNVSYVDASDFVVSRLQSHGYDVHVLGAPEKNITLKAAAAFLTSDTDAVAQAVAAHDLLFTAAGGANLPAIGRLIAKGLDLRLTQRGGAAHAGDCNIIICENYKKPANILRDAIKEHASPATVAWMNDHLGIAETQVLRSCIEPTDEMKKQDPLSLQVQDWWVLPCDADAIRGTPPAVEGLSFKPNFENELIRKLYTYNCSNAVIGYLGYLRGHVMLAQAANDAQILAIAREAYKETGEALIREFDFDPAEHRKLQELALSKYRDEKIADPIERNCRDSRRKLSADDRLMGPALLASKNGVQPHAVCLAIAAAFFYEGSDDEGTKAVRQFVTDNGVPAAIKQFCGIDETHTLFPLITASVGRLSMFTNAPRKQ